MDPPGQLRSATDAFGDPLLRRVAGVLVVCGHTPDAAATIVGRTVRRALRDGLAGGSGAAGLVRREVLEGAGPPRPPRPPLDAVEAALGALPWRDRLGTVCTAVFDDRGFGPGDPAGVAAACGCRPEALPDVLDGAVTKASRSVPPLDVSAQVRGAGRQRAALALTGVVVALALGALIALGINLVW